MKTKKLILPIMCILMITMIANSGSAMVVNTSISGSFRHGNGIFIIASTHGSNTVITTFDSDDVYIPRTIRTGDNVCVSYTHTLVEDTDADGNTIFVWVKSNVCITEIPKSDENNCGPKTAAPLLM